MKTKYAFTLIELLVVIAIIAVLMGILMPTLRRIRKQTQSITCRAHLRNWGLFFKLYTDDHDGKFHAGQNFGGLDLWMNVFYPYHKNNPKLMRCPTAKKVAEPGGEWGTIKSWQYYEGSTRTFIGSYGTNNWIDNMTHDRGARKLEWFWRSTQNIKHNPNSIPIFGDSTWHDAWPLDTDTPAPTPDGFRIGNQGETLEMRHFAIDRHNGTVNMVFMDWSVRPVGIKEHWTLKWHRTFNTTNAFTLAGGVQTSDWPSWMQRYRDY
jgi:prepilin-type N-terminal cleavage/methylation domain-containing protein/prepilin-type processing-associated H-X9-DG protein